MMAVPPATLADLDATYEQAQRSLSQVLVQNLITAWALLSFADLDATTPAWMAVASPLTIQARARSIGLATSWLRARTSMQTGLAIRPVAPLLTAQSIEAVETSLRVTGPVTVKTLTASGLAPEAAMRTALVQTTGAAERHALTGARQVSMLTAKAPAPVLLAPDPAPLEVDPFEEEIDWDIQDPEPESERLFTGWERVARSTACGFCKMLASRGAVYRSEDSSGFAAHDHCGCYASPVVDPSAAKKVRDFVPTQRHQSAKTKAKNRARADAFIEANDLNG